MPQHPTHLSLAQLTVIMVSTMVMISHPDMALMVAVFVGSIMAFSMASAVAVGYHYSSHQIEELSNQHASLLGTHFGGILCYLIMLNHAFEHIH